MKKYDFGYTDYPEENFKSQDYLRLCDILLQLAPNERVRKKMEGILFHGGFEDYSVNDHDERMNQGGPHFESKKRIGMAWVLAHSEETFDVIRSQKIAYFHGTNSTALPEILTKGLNSMGKIKREGGQLTSGEEWSMQFRMGENSSNFVSITDDIDSAGDYSSKSPKGAAKGQPSFGVVLGFKEEALDKLKTLDVDSDCVEMGIEDGIPPELISFIGVPADKVEMVKKMVNNPNVHVMPMDFKGRCYFIDSECIYLFEHNVQKLLEGRKEPQKAFGIDAFKKLAKTRTIGKLLESMRRLKETFKKKTHKKDDFNQDR